MPLFIQYLVKFSVSLSLVYLFYQLLLRRITFYNYNRVYLLGYSLLSFIIPFVNVNPLIEKSDLSNARIIYYIPAFDGFADNTMHWWNIVLIILVIGSLCMIIRLCVQVISLQKMKRNATKINDVAITVYHVEKSILPFSFGNNIYINQHLHSEKELSDIILHEYVHVKQKHTIDILLAELLCIFNWYNPFAWLIRKAIRQNLEFIADNKVLQTGMNKKNYQYHLLKVTGMPQYAIATNFNFSSLKKRIAMMNKIKTAKVQLLRFLFVLPLLAVVLLAFRNNSIGDKQINEMVLPPAMNAADSVPDAKENTNQISVMSVMKDDSTIKITLKNGKTETYDLKKPAQKKVFENKYGVILKQREALINKMKIDQELIMNKQLKEMELSSKEMQLKLMEQMESINAAQETWKRNLQNGSDTLYEQLLAKKGVQDDALKMLLDSAYQKNMLLDKLNPLQENLLKEKLMSEQYNDLFKSYEDKLKTNDKMLLKKMQEELRLQKIELQRHLQELKLQELEIEKRLKHAKDEVSHNRTNISADYFSRESVMMTI